MDELADLFEYYERAHSSKKRPQLCAIALSSRKNMCVHPEVSKAKYGKIIDGS